MLKRTALFEEHVRLGGRMVDFGGWELPVQYSGVMDEHTACRNAAGLFDVSHMGEIHVEGPAAEAYLDVLVTNSVTRIADGQAQYTAMCHESGGIVDDLIVYRRSAGRYLVVVNASNTDKDFTHFNAVAQGRFEKELAAGSLKITNESANYTQIAIQGRNAVSILQPLTDVGLSTVKTYWFAEGKVLGSISAIVARTGYTGEDGFEIYVAWEKGPELWRALLEAGNTFGLKPCGLGARDTLRLEMKYPLYGHELGDNTNPLETGLAWVTKLDKTADFVGKRAIVAAKERGLKRSLVGLKLVERGIPRQGYSVYDSTGTTCIGEITSGTQSPSLKLSVGVASLDCAHSAIGTRVTVDIRGTKTAAEIIPTPFYQPPYLKKK